MPLALATRRRPAACMSVLVATFALLVGACSGDDEGNRSASRNSSNFNTRSIVAFGDEVPTLPAARSITRGTVEHGAWRKTYEVAAPAADVLAFYERELPSTGWTTGGTPSGTPGGSEATWRRPGFRLTVSVAPGAAGSTTTAPETAVPAVSTVDLTLRRSASG
jgi:hypothetical protein